MNKNSMNERTRPVPAMQQDVRQPGKTRVVVYCCNPYVSLGLVRCLGEAGYRPECYCVGDGCEFLLASKYISKGRVFKSPEDVLEYLLDEYPCHEDKPFLFTIPDPPAYLVDMHQDRLKEKFILMSAGEPGKIAFWMDKRNMAAMAEKHGLVVPWTLELSRDGDIPDSLEYPVFTKSIRTVDGGKADESICQNREELESRKATMASDRFLVMKYIRKVKEISYFGMSVKGKVYIDYRDEIDRFPDGAYGYYGIFRQCDHDDTYRNCISMMEEIGYEGLFDVEFLEGEDGILYFMEVNFRVDGAIYKLTGGVNLPAEWCRLACMGKEKLPETLPLGRERFTGMTELFDFKTSVVDGHMNPFKWFWDFCTADKLMLVNLKDPKPFFACLCWLAKDWARKKILRRKA